MTNAEIEMLAQRLEDARRAGRSIGRLTLTHPELSIEDAYSVQHEGVELRKRAGEQVIGYKMGLTSKAKRDQMGLDAPVYGVLTDRMQVDGAFALAGSIHPKIEPELAFRLGKTLRAPVTLEEAAAACTHVYAAMEILDSRYENFKYFSLPDVVADNSSSSHFVVAAEGRPLKEVALDGLEMTMSINGEPRQSARSDAISGHPLQSLVQLCELLRRRGAAVPAGSIVLAGAATVAEPLREGDRIRLTVTGLPPAEVVIR